MNKKLLSIACMVLALCGVSTPFAADVTILGVPARQLISSSGVKMTITPASNEITMLNISTKGIEGETGGFTGTSDASACVKDMFAENPPRLVAGSFTTASASARLGGSIVGKSELTISAERFSFQPLTVFGTNGEFTLNFTNSHSLIKSLTMTPSNITAPFNGEELHIGSVWGDFTGAPSSEEQIIHLIGYPSITIEFNPAGIAEVLSKK